MNLFLPTTSIASAAAGTMISPAPGALVPVGKGSQFLPIPPEVTIPGHSLVFLNGHAGAFRNTPPDWEHIKSVMGRRCESVMFSSADIPRRRERHFHTVDLLEKTKPNQVFVASGDGKLREVMAAIANPGRVLAHSAMNLHALDPLQGIKCVAPIPIGTYQSTNKTINGPALSDVRDLDAYLAHPEAHRVFDFGLTWMRYNDGDGERMELICNSAAAGVSSSVFSEFIVPMKQAIREQRLEVVPELRRKAFAETLTAGADDRFSVTIQKDGGDPIVFDDAVELAFFGVPLGLGALSLPFTHPIAGPQYSALIFVLPQSILKHLPLFVYAAITGRLAKEGWLTHDPRSLSFFFTLLKFLTGFDASRYMIPIRHNETVRVNLERPMKMLVNGDLSRGQIDEFHLMASPPHCSVPILGHHRSMLARSQDYLASRVRRQSLQIPGR